MAKPIDHDFASSTATAAWGATKGGIIGLLAGIVAGGVIAAGLAVGAAAVVGWALPGITAAGAAAWMFHGGALLTTAIGVIGGLSASVEGMWVGTAGGILGGLFGLAGGANKASREKSAFRNQAMNAARTQGASQNDAAMVGMQQGYMAGFQEGQEYVVTQLRQHMQEQMMATGLQAHGGHAAKVGHCAPCASKVEALTQQREAEASAVKQV